MQKKRWEKGNSTSPSEGLFLWGQELDPNRRTTRNEEHKCDPALSPKVQEKQE